MSHQQRDHRDHREEKTVEHHVRERHLGQRNLAEEESAAPKRACDSACYEAQGAPLMSGGHISTVAQNEAGAV
jgi:hypothetical protein